MDSRLRGKDEGVREGFKYYLEKGFDIMAKGEWIPACAGKTTQYEKSLNIMNKIGWIVAFEGKTKEFESGLERVDSRLRGKDAAVEGKSKVQGSRMI